MRLVPMVALLILAAPSARAVPAGINFAWNECAPDGGSSLHYFACDTSVATPVGVAVGSFVPAQDMPQFVGVEIRISLEAAASTLPDWWQVFNPGSCRQPSLSFSPDSVSLKHEHCLPAFAIRPDGGIGAYQTIATSPPVPVNDAAAAYIKVYYATNNPQPLFGGTEYVACVMRIDGARTTEPGACSGCDVPVCIALTQVTISDGLGGQQILRDPIQNQLIGWQCGNGTMGRTGMLQIPIVASCDAPPAPCVTPVRNHTWGTIKSLYR
jgi:hypothetical protein